MMELLFEKHNSPATFLVKDAVLGAFAVGKHAALVVNVGGGVTSTVTTLQPGIDHLNSYTLRSQCTMDTYSIKE